MYKFTVTFLRGYCPFWSSWMVKTANNKNNPLLISKPFSPNQNEGGDSYFINGLLLGFNPCPERGHLEWVDAKAKGLPSTEVQGQGFEIEDWIRNQSLPSGQSRSSLYQNYPSDSCMFHLTYQRIECKKLVFFQFFCNAKLFSYLNSFTNSKLNCVLWFEM